MIRETISGAVTEYSKFYVPEGTRPRSSRRGKSSPRKQDQNDRDAAKRLARILNCNFRAGDALVTLTYAAETERAEGEKKVKNFLRRLKRQCMPHVCGDEVRINGIPLAAVVYAPRMWG